MINKIALICVLLSLYLFLMPLNVSAVNYYDFTYKIINDTTPTGSITGVSFDAMQNCQTTLRAKVTSSDTGFFLNSNYYSPGSTPIGTSALSNINTPSCYTISQFSTDSSLNGFYDGKMDYTTSASALNVYLENEYSCSTDDRYITIISDINHLDNNGYVPNMLSCGYDGTVGGTGCSFSDIFYINDECAGTKTLTLTDNISSYSRGSGKNNVMVITAYPFKTGIGHVDYEIDLGNSSRPIASCSGSSSHGLYINSEWGYVDLENDVKYQLGSSTKECYGSSQQIYYGIVNNSVDLLENHKYAFYTYSYSTGFATPIITGASVRKPDYAKMTIDIYQPDWECSDLTECVNGSKIVNCYDKNGIALNKTMTEECNIPYTADVYLGFEDYTTTQDGLWFCEPSALICKPGQITTTNLKTPNGWYLSRHYATDANAQKTAVLENFADIEEGDATEGSNSLKMWSIPIKEYEPIQFDSGAGSVVTCGNYTKARFPETYTLYNESLFIAYNITFTSPYAQIVYDVKRCPDTPEQWDYSGWFGCGKECYGNCGEEPSGNYGVRIAEIGKGRRNILNYPFIYYDNNGNDKTSDVLYNDYYTNYAYIKKKNNKPLINITEGSIDNNSVVTFIYQADTTNATIYITDENYTITYGSFNTGMNTVGKFIKSVGLENVPEGTKEIYLTDRGETGSVGIYIYIDQIKVENFDEFQTYNLVYDTTKDAPISWATREIDFSNNPIFEPGKNYTIAFGIKSSEYTQNNTCVMFDNVRATYRNEVQPCKSQCDLDNPRNYKEAQIEDGICTYTIYENDYRCVEDWEENQTSGCIGTTWSYLDENNNWVYVENSTLCTEKTTEQDQVKNEVSGFIDAGFQFVGIELTSSLLFIVNFMIGALLIILSAAYASTKEVDSEIIMLIMLVLVYVNAILGFWAWELAVVISVGIILVFSEKIKGILGGG